MPDPDKTSESSSKGKRSRTAEIKKLLALMEAHELEELEVSEGEFRVRLKQAARANPQPAAQEAGPPATKPLPKPEQPEGEFVTMTAKLVGTFYRSPAPDAPPYVEVGDPIDEDTVVCIIEAMKVMNEVKAGMVGTIQRILVENMTPVEYGQPLFEVMP